MASWNAGGGIRGTQVLATQQIFFLFLSPGPIIMMWTQERRKGEDGRINRDLVVV